MLHPFIGRGQNKYEFVIGLIDQIMQEPITEHDKELQDKCLYNPLEKNRNTLEAYFSGKRQISKKAAGAIISRLDPDRFRSYLSGLNLNPNVINMLKDKLRTYMKDIVTENVIDVITNLFVSILKRRANVYGVQNEPENVRQSLYERMDQANQDAIFEEAHELFKCAKKDSRVAEQIRDLFTQYSKDCYIVDFIREYVAERIEESDIDLNQDSLNDIHGFLQTIYENCIEEGAYIETAILFDTLHDYIEKTVYSTSLCSQMEDEIANFRGTIIGLLIDLDVLN